MENPQIEPPKIPIHFTRRQRSHLQSQTYTNLVRILSHCYKNPHLCKTPKIIPQELAPGANDSNEPKEVSEKEVLLHSELVTPDGVDHKDPLVQTKGSVDENVQAIGFQDGGFSDTQAVIDEIENIMRIEEDVDTFKQKDLKKDVGSDGNNSLEDKDFSQLQQSLMNELEHVMKGNEKVIHDNSCDFVTSLLDEGLCDDGDAVAFSNNQSEDVDSQAFVKKDYCSVSMQQVDKECASQNTCEIIDSSSGISVVCKVSNLSGNNEERISSPRTSELEVHHEIQQKEMESGQLICANDALGCSNIIEDGEMEEGEISGEFAVSDRLVVLSPKDSVLPQEQNKQLSEEFVDKNNCPSSDKKELNRKDSITADIVSIINTREAETKDIRKEMPCKRKVVVYEDPILAQEPDRCKKQKKGCETKEQKKSSRDKGKKKGDVGNQIMCSNNLTLSSKKTDQDATGSQGITCKEKNPGLPNKKKRGPPSEERKAKKKEKKRKKRAQKNRELGVKRLKLRPVEKPKPVVLCRHYIRGRCHEGENCKFSHDTIPLTKSKPCCHFARNSCLKGDDCPFDHQLSKYPCTNYASTGSCSRGEDCMFSHKLPVKEDLPTTSEVCTPDTKPPSLLNTSNSKKLLDSGGTTHHTAKASTETGRGLSCKDTQKNAPKSVQSLHIQAPKGISFLSTGSTPGSSSLTMNKGFDAGNQGDQNASGSVENSNDIPKRTPAALIPKGINFLSFGKTSSEFSGTKKLTSNSGANSSLSSNFDVHKKSSFPFTVGNNIQVGKEMSESVSNSTPLWNRMLQKTEVAVSPLKSNILSFIESSANASKGNGQDSLPSCSTTPVDKSLQASEISPDKHRNLMTISQGQSASPLGSGQSADYFAHPCLKNSSNSAQKALLSTLAFAAKVESQMKVKQSTVGALAVSSRVNKGTEDIGTSRGSQNNSAKALKILDFLSSVGDKMKQ